MAENMSVSNPSIPLFKGDNYEFWSIKIRTLLKSQGLWELVETGAPSDASTSTETAKRDAKALFFIQQAVVDTVFVKIAAATSAKEAWTTLKTAFRGSSRVMAIKLQGLRRDFETLQMKYEESVQIFLSRVTAVVNQIRAYEDNISEQTVVAKVLRSLTPKFDHVVAAIEESKDLSSYTFDELMGSLLTHEARLSKSEEKSDEKAFHMKGENRGRNNNNTRGRGRGHRGGFQERGGRGRAVNTNQNSAKQSQKSMECYYCHKVGHAQVDCYKKERDQNRDVE